MKKKQVRRLKHKHTDMGENKPPVSQESLRRSWPCCLLWVLSISMGAVCLCDLNHLVSAPVISRKVTQRRKWQGFSESRA